MPRGKSLAGLRAERRAYEFVGVRIKGFDENGAEQYDRVYLTTCVDCRCAIESTGRKPTDDPEALAYRLNWRCEPCREVNRAEREEMRDYRQASKPTKRADEPARDFSRMNRIRRMHACRDLV